MEEFEIQNKVLVKYNGTAEEVTIPDGVIKIGKEAFGECKTLKSLTIPASVKEIIDHAFIGCEFLEQLNIVEGVKKIGWGAFLNCKSLKSVTIPASVTAIGKEAFRGCCSLEQVILCEGIESIGIGAFGSCIALKTIAVPSSVGCIGKYAFQECRTLEQIALPNRLEQIENYIFENCTSLCSIMIPSAVKEIEIASFKGCTALTTLTFDGEVPKSMKPFVACPIRVIYAQKTYVAAFSFHKQAYLAGFAQLIDRGVAIRQIFIEKNNQYIKENIQKVCDTNSEELFVYILKNKLIPLKDVDALIKIFGQEKNVARVAALIDYKEKNFTEKQKERQFNRQFEIKEPTEYSMLRKVWSFSKKEDGTYRISAYKGDEIDIVIPSMINGVKVTEVGSGKKPPYYKNLFFGDFAKKIRSITLQDGIERIADYTFQLCTSLKTVTLPASIKEIGEDAFALCESLEQILLPEGLETIERLAFNYCHLLKTITIPVSVKRIGQDAFFGCFGLTVYCKSDEKPADWDETWDRIKFEDCKVKVVWGYKGE